MRKGGEGVASALEPGLLSRSWEQRRKARSAGAGTKEKMRMAESKGRQQGEIPGHLLSSSSPLSVPPIVLHRGAWEMYVENGSIPALRELPSFVRSHSTIDEKFREEKLTLVLLTVVF